MTIFVEYRVPVLVEVDESEDRVLSVRVDDESISEPLDVVDADLSQVSAGRRAHVIAVAETSNWPAWTVGV